MTTVDDFDSQRENAYQMALNELAYRFFKDPADEDYLVARFAWFEGFPRQFFWSASQAIEKYIKCSLFVNGCSAKFKHNWYSKFAAKKDLACSSLRFLPKDFSQLANFDKLPPAVDLEKQETTDAFLKRISDSGHPGVRYDEIGSLQTNFLDLRKLDFVCVWLWAICDLDAKSETCPSAREIAVHYLKNEKSSWLTKANFALFPDLESDEFGYLRHSSHESGAQMTVRRAEAHGVDLDRLFSEFSERSICSKETLEKLRSVNQEKPFSADQIADLMSRFSD